MCVCLASFLNVSSHPSLALALSPSRPHPFHPFQVDAPHAPLKLDERQEDEDVGDRVHRQLCRLSIVPNPVTPSEPVRVVLQVSIPDFPGGKLVDFVVVSLGVCRL